MSNGVNVIFDQNYLKNSKKVQDKKIFKLVERKFEFIKIKGLNYPSLNAKKLHNVFSDDGVPLWEFYITKKWRCIFTFDDNKNQIVVIKISNHL